MPQGVALSSNQCCKCYSIFNRHLLKKIGNITYATRKLIQPCNDHIDMAMWFELLCSVW